MSYSVCSGCFTLENNSFLPEKRLVAQIAKSNLFHVCVFCVQLIKGSWTVARTLVALRHDRDTSTE